MTKIYFNILNDNVRMFWDYIRIPFSYKAFIKNSDEVLLLCWM